MSTSTGETKFIKRRTQKKTSEYKQIPTERENEEVTLKAYLPLIYSQGFVSSHFMFLLFPFN